MITQNLVLFILGNIIKLINLIFEIGSSPERSDKRKHKIDFNLKSLRCDLWVPLLIGLEIPLTNRESRF